MSAPPWHPEASSDRSAADPALYPRLAAAETGGPWRDWAVWILGCVAAALLIVSVNQQSHARSITYTVSSNNPTARAFVSYRSVDGDVHGDLELPWETTVEVGKAAVLHVRADRGTTSVRCTITSGNLTLAADSSLGASASTTCAVGLYLYPANSPHRPNRSPYPSSSGNPTPSLNPLVNRTNTAKPHR